MKSKLVLSNKMSGIYLFFLNENQNEIIKTKNRKMKYVSKAT